MQQPENETQIGPYKLVDRIGQGGTSVVYRAIDTRNDQKVALKVLTPLFATDPKFLRRFINEGKNVKLLEHPNIVRVFDASEADDRQFIAMELIEGGSLSGLIKTREHILPIDETLAIIKQIADALDYAHSMGILHRDIKLSNILITTDGRYVLTDFGSAKQMSMENTVVTQSGFSVGTPTFMSPEQAKGDPNIDRRTDVYSLGVAAYALLVGKLPFQADSQVALLHKIIYDAPPAPESVNPTIPPGIAYALKRVLCKEPQLRYSTAGEFADALIEGKTWIPGTMDYAAIPSQYLTGSSQIAAANRQVTDATAQRSRTGLLSLLSLLGVLLLGLVFVLLFMTNMGEGLRDSIIARPDTQATAITISENESTPSSSANSENPNITIEDYVAALEAGEFTQFTAENERFGLNVPTGWNQTTTGDTTNFDANNFVGRLFIHEADSSNSPVDSGQVLEQYYQQARQEGTYKDLKTVSDQSAGLVQVAGRDAHQEILTGKWFDSDVQIRLLSLATESGGFVIGNIVASDETEQVQPFMNKLVDGFTLNADEVDRVAGLSNNAGETTQPIAEETEEVAETPTVQATTAPDGSATAGQISSSTSSTDSATAEAESDGSGALTVGQVLQTPTAVNEQEGIITTLSTANPLSAPTDTPEPPTATSTDVPPTDTPEPPTATSTDVPPTDTDTPEPPTATSTDVPPTDTDTPEPPTATSTDVPPTDTDTPEPATATSTSTDVPPTDTPEPATATSTSTDVPSTDTPEPPTATSTATDVPPTDTPEPPTATSTATDVPSTDTPEPPTATSTATDVPATDTPEPPTATSTATEVPPTDTPEPATATSTNVPPTATFTPPPTATFTPPPTATRVPPTATFTPIPPTATRIPPTPTFTPPPTATFTPMPTRPFLFPPGAFRIIKPDVFDTDSGRTYFEWTSTTAPAPGQAYELVFWKAGQDILVDSFGVAQPTLANQLTVDLEFQDRALGDLLNPGTYFWTVLLVNEEPYQRLQILGDIRELVVVRKAD